jgi:hypothetical protein
MSEAPPDEDEYDPGKLRTPAKVARGFEKSKLHATIGPRSKVSLDFQFRSLPLLSNKKVEEDPDGASPDINDFENVPTVTMNFDDAASA